MTAHMRRRRVLSTVAAWALAAAGLAAPAAATEHLGPSASGGDETGSRTFAASVAAGVGARSSDTTSGVGVSVSTVSAPVVVPADALWTFDEVELTVTSTITITEVHVGLRGHQAEIDRCDGPVVSDYGAYGYGKVIGEHNHCGGAYVLELEVGDVVRLTGYEAGDYAVAFLMDVPKKNTPVTVLGGGDLFLQTCHFSGGQMRLVALTPQ